MKGTDINKNIEKWCERKGKTLHSLAKDGTISFGTYFNMKSGKSITSIRTIRRICDKLDITPGEFFEGRSVEE